MVRGRIVHSRHKTYMGECWFRTRKEPNGESKMTKTDLKTNKRFGPCPPKGVELKKNQREKGGKMQDF